MLATSATSHQLHHWIHHIELEPMEQKEDALWVRRSSECETQTSGLENPDSLILSQVCSSSLLFCVVCIFIALFCGVCLLWILRHHTHEIWSEGFVNVSYRPLSAWTHSEFTLNRNNADKVNVDSWRKYRSESEIFQRSTKTPPLNFHTLPVCEWENVLWANTLPRGVGETQGGVWQWINRNCEQPITCVIISKISAFSYTATFVFLLFLLQLITVSCAITFIDLSNSLLLTLDVLCLINPDGHSIR